MAVAGRLTALVIATLTIDATAGFATIQHRPNALRRRVHRDMSLHEIDVHDALAKAQLVTGPLASRVQEWLVHSTQHMHSGTFSPAGLKLLKSYETLLHAHPLMTKAATAGCLAALGDAVAQKQAEEKYDALRGVSFAFFAAAYTGAFQHFWFGWLNDKLAFTAALSSPSLALLLATPSSPAILAAGKLGLNQFIVVPFIYMPLFFVVTGAISLSVEESIERARRLYFPLLLRNYAFWLPAQFIQFSLVDPEWQVPYICAASLLWNVVLSSVSGRAATSGVQLNDSAGVDVTETVTLSDVGVAFADATGNAADALIDRGSLVVDAVEDVATDATYFVSDVVSDAGLSRQNATVCV